MTTQNLTWQHCTNGHRPDLRQMILAVVIDGDGRPVCSEMWPGNTADVTTLIPVIERLRRRFAIARVCVVADDAAESPLARFAGCRTTLSSGPRPRTNPRASLSHNGALCSDRESATAPSWKSGWPYPEKLSLEPA